MKQTVLLLLLATGIANRAGGQVSFGLEAGLLRSNFKIQLLGLNAPTTGKTGFKAGGVMDCPFNEKFSFEPGLFYERNGVKLSQFIITADLTIHTIKIPLNVKYHYTFENGNSLFAAVGPFVALNMGGRLKYTLPDSSFTSIVSYENNIAVGADSSSFIAAFDFGIGANAGYQMKNGLFARAFYQYGIYNMIPPGQGDNVLKCFNGGLSIGYYFGRKNQEVAKPHNIVKYQ